MVRWVKSDSFSRKIPSYSNFWAEFDTAGVTIYHHHLPIQLSVKTVFLCLNYLFYNNFSTLQKSGGKAGGTLLFLIFAEVPGHRDFKADFGLAAVALFLDFSEQSPWQKHQAEVYCEIFHANYYRIWQWNKAKQWLLSTLQSLLQRALLLPELTTSAELAALLFKTTRSKLHSLRVVLKGVVTGSLKILPACSCKK